MTAPQGLSSPSTELKVEKRVFFWALAWPLFVLGAYFLKAGRPFTHPFGFWDASRYPPFEFSRSLPLLAQSLFILGLVFLIGLVTWSWGRRVREWLTLTPLSAWTAAAFDFGLGILVLNAFWLGTGLTGLWWKPVWMGAGLFFLAGTGWDWVKKKSRGSSFSFRVLDGDFPSLVLFSLGILYFLFSVLHGLLPETFYDSMVYHLAVPSNWLLHHGIVDDPSNFFSNYPFGGELYFLNGLAWGGTEAAKLLHSLSLGACALLAGGWAGELGGRTSARMAAGLTLTLPLFCLNAWSTQVEGMEALTVLLFLYSLDKFATRETSNVRWALAAGLFAGLSLSVKYASLFGLGSGSLALLWNRRSAFGKSAGRQGAVLAGACLAVVGPWLLKNFLFTGNPCFPYLMDWFHGRHLPQEGYQKLLEEQRALVPGGLVSYLLLPWKLTLSTPDSYNFCGPVALAFAPLLLFFRFRHFSLRFLALATTFYFLFGLFSTHTLRFLLPAFPVLYVLLAAVLGGGSRPVAGGVFAFAGSLSAVLCFFSLAAISSLYYGGAGVWSGRQSRGDYLVDSKRLTPYFEMSRWVSGHTPDGSRLLIAGDARGLYYDRPFLANSVFDAQVLAVFAREEKDASGIARRLQKAGVDYLVVNGWEGLRTATSYHLYDLGPREWHRLDDFIQRGVELVWSQGLQGVYRVKKELSAGFPVPATPNLLSAFQKGPMK